MTSQWIYDHTKYEFVVLPSYTRPSYSNLGFALLGRVPEPGLNQTFEDYTIENIFGRLGMSNTGYDITSEVWSKMAQGYDFSLQPYSSYPSEGWETPAGGAFSSTRDLAELLIQFIKSHDMIDSPILKAQTMKMMTQAAFLDYDGQTLFSYPWESFFVDSYFVRCKAGNTDGFSGGICVIPELKLGFTTLFNADIDTFAYLVPVMEILIPAFNYQLRLLPVQALLPPNPSAFTGLFAPYPSAGVAIKIKISFDTENGNDRLLLSVNHYSASNATMNYIGDNAFQLIAPNSSPSRFMGSCQTIETSAFQYEGLYYSTDLMYFHMGNGGVYKRESNV